MGVLWIRDVFETQCLGLMGCKAHPRSVVVICTSRAVVDGLVHAVLGALLDGLVRAAGEGLASVVFTLAVE